MRTTRSSLACLSSGVTVAGFSQPKSVKVIAKGKIRRAEGEDMNKLQKHGKKARDDYADQACRLSIFASRQ
jgi:hypothetical protein